MGGGELPSPPGPFSFLGRFRGFSVSPVPAMSPHPPGPGLEPAALRVRRSPASFLAHSTFLAFYWLLVVPVATAPPFFFAPPSLSAPPLARTDWSGVMSLRLLLCVHWVALLSVTPLRRWRRWRPFWSRARGRTQRRERRAPPLPAMAAPLGTGAFTEETGQEKQDSEKDKGLSPERAEEAKLKAKYPNLGQKPGGSDFLMKRLQKGAWLIIPVQRILSGSGSAGVIPNLAV
ncbi:alpha-endosulfine isoform X3 [Haemorhous mexicanus]|uniref:alpha-endosulfine isoform X3 n=1 Tax=Haemorhous mexicanus TaxID=30427 RepID=UPI0028BEC6D3|nr:alpha-endosulfine isoform X3 [Haemorhous mexicanus]